MVALVQELRRKAAFCRRAASISTSGRTDRILLALAEQLEREAALRERQLQDGTPTASQIRPARNLRIIAGRKARPLTILKEDYTCIFQRSLDRSQIRSLQTRNPIDALSPLNCRVAHAGSLGKRGR